MIAQQARGCLWHIRLAASAVIVGLAAVVLSGCGGADQSTAGTMTFMPSVPAPFAADFNPFSPTAQLAAQGLIYEPLWFFDMADATRTDPWLATSYKWSRGGKTITFGLRHNVRWTDGQPFTSRDVAFTFNLMKSHPALNPSALPISDAVTKGPYSVAINFSHPAYSDINYIAGTTYIVPEHIWKNIPDPSKYQDPHPVGTGAYTPVSVSGQVMTFKANPHYYMTGLPRIKTIRYLYFSSNTTADISIENGSVDWGTAYIPDVRHVYIDKNPGYRFYDIPSAVTNLIPNMVSGPTTSLAVRKAISYAIDRKLVSQDVYGGFNGQINQTGLVQPLFRDVTDPSLDKPYVYSAALARSTLKSAGYTLAPNGYFEKSGRELTISAQVPSGYTDYISDLQIMARDLKAAGINLVIDSESLSQYSSNEATGKFQLIMAYTGFTPSPYVYYHNLLYSDGIPPIGKVDGVGDYGRYSNSTINSLLNAIAATPRVAVQRPYFYKIEAIVARNMPTIPVLNQDDSVEFNGNHVTGEATPANPYAQDIPIAPDYAWVSSRLSLVK